jgi:DNA-binding transcriptional LysR family regulator
LEVAVRARSSVGCDGEGWAGEQEAVHRVCSGDHQYARISGDVAALRHGRLRWAGRAWTHGTGEGRWAPSSDGFCFSLSAAASAAAAVAQGAGPSFVPAVTKAGE